MSSGRISTRPGQRGDPATEALGRSRGGFSTKLHLRTEGGGKPLVVVLSPGQHHESRFVPALLERGAVKRLGPGRPRLRPRRVAGDKGFSYRRVRAYLRRRGIGALIPTRSDQRRLPHFDPQAYRGRNVVERTINRLKQFRRVATRDEKRAVNYLAVLTIASILLWL